jgi:hypothetical protein
MVLRAELLLLLLAGAAVAWDPTPHYEMVACHGGSTDDKPCQFYPGTKVWAARRSPLAARRHCPQTTRERERFLDLQ